MKLRKPCINARDLPGQVRQIVSFLNQMVDDLNFSGSQDEKAEAKTVQAAPQGQYMPVGTVYRTVGSNHPRSTFGGRWEKRADDGDEHVWVRIS